MKFTSGRFILCCVGAFSLLLFTFLICAVTWVNKDSDVIKSLIPVVSSAITGIITFYFTKKTNENTPS